MKDIFGDVLEHIFKNIESVQADQETLRESSVILKNAEKYHVLCIEDKSSEAKILETSLQDLGISSRVFNTSTDPESQFYTEFQEIDKYTCAFIDKNLGDKNGITYISNILKERPEYPIILITAESLHNAIEKLRKENLHDKIYLLEVV